MTDLLRSPINSNLTVAKLQDAVSNLTQKLKESTDGKISSAINNISQALNTYFKELAEAEFKPEFLLENDSPRAALYNKNLSAIHNDIKRFYEELKNLADAQVNSYNFAQIVTQEILNKANGLASIVLDLNILSNFDRGDVIVAGDDFNNTDYLDFGIGLGSDAAELLPGGGGIALARDSAIDVIDEATKMEVIPISPTNGKDKVTIDPTPGNLERFYEGNYYNFLGLARPEGGRFNIKFLLEPNEDSSVDNEEQGLLVDLGATEEEKKSARLNMFDRDPSTFWECEFLYRLDKPLLGDLADDAALESDGTSDTAPKGATVTIDLKQAEKLAKEFDFPGRDLIVDLIITLPEAKVVNFIAINPVVFGSDSFPEVADISTSSSEEGTFSTIPGWESLKFAKFITQEANEFLTDSQSSAILAPSKSSFKGQGVFPFPAIEAKKVKIRLKVDNPVAAPYERIYALLSTSATVTSTTTTTTKKGLFR